VAGDPFALAEPDPTNRPGACVGRAPGVDSLPAKPVVIGHSFSGLIVEKLLEKVARLRASPLGRVPLDR
jgi:hypothetical protein